MTEYHVAGMRAEMEKLRHIGDALIEQNERSQRRYERMVALLAEIEAMVAANSAAMMAALEQVKW